MTSTIGPPADSVNLCTWRVVGPRRTTGPYYRLVGSDANAAIEAPAGPVHAALDAAVRGIAGLASVDDVAPGHRRPRPAARRGASTRPSASSTPDGRIERFITSGIDDETRRRLGPLPEGHGLLGLIIRENRSFRIPDLNADSRRVTASRPTIRR